MTRPLVRTSMGLALTIAVLAVGGSSTVFAADAAEPEPVIAEPLDKTTLESVKGNKLRIAKARAAKEWARFKDPVGDQITLAGGELTGAEPWTDLTEVNVVRAGAATKMLRVLGEDYPPGTVGGYYGADADWQSGQDAFYIIARLDAKIPTDLDADLQLIVTFDGPDGVPLDAGGLLGPYMGAQTFSLSGPFPGRGWETGTTNLAEWDGTSPIPFFNGPSQDLGYYDFKSGSILHVARVPKGAASATVTLRAAGPNGDIFDEIRLPSGGRFIGLDSPDWGLNLKKGGVPLVCRSVATFSAGSEGAEDVEPGMSVIRYTVAWPAGEPIGNELAALGDTVELALTSVGTEGAPENIQAVVAVDAASDSATFSVQVPDGQWLLGATETTPLQTAGGQALVDLRPLTGIAGLRTAPGLDGFVAGDPTCGS